MGIVNRERFRSLEDSLVPLMFAMDSTLLGRVPHE
jgi:hypothetical protein